MATQAATCGSAHSAFCAAMASPTGGSGAVTLPVMNELWPRQPCTRRCSRRASCRSGPASFALCSQAMASRRAYTRSTSAAYCFPASPISGTNTAAGPAAAA
nr:hypothetical protein GJNJKBEO_00072 [Bovine alphaherpesvirus 1]